VAQSQPRKRRCSQADRPTILNSKTYDRADDLNIHILSSPNFLSLAGNRAWTFDTAVSVFAILVYYSFNPNTITLNTPTRLPFARLLPTHAPISRTGSLF
jgi:hypothetical protein